MTKREEKIIAKYSKSLYTAKAYAVKKKWQIDQVYKHKYNGKLEVHNIGGVEFIYDETK